jgi:hypothetical protein
MHMSFESPELGAQMITSLMSEAGRKEVSARPNRFMIVKHSLQYDVGDDLKPINILAFVSQ